MAPRESGGLTGAYGGRIRGAAGERAMDVLIWVLGLTAWVVVGFLVAWWFGRMMRDRDRH